jgi:UDP-glucose 4-epimerase
MMTFLVTGAAGFIGSHSVDRLLEKGFSVVGIDNLRTGNLKNLVHAQLLPRFAFYQTDVTDEKELRVLFQRHNFRGVLHLAALVSVPESFTEPESNSRINLVGSDLIGRLCVEYGCRRLVFASSAAVYGDIGPLPNREPNEPNPRSPYAAAKLAGEVMLLGYAASFHLEVVCFRYFNVYGPRQNPHSPYSGVLSIFLERFRSSLPVTVYGDGEQTRDFVSVEDVRRANCHALTADEVVTGRYNVCSGRTTSLNQVLEILGKAYSHPSPVRYSEPRIGDIRHSLGDPELAKKVLGIESRISVEEGLSKMIGADSESL